MDIHQTPKEKLKTDIYDIYTRFFAETSSVRRQVYYGQIWEKIVLWCNKYLKINANEMGIEIYNVIKRIVNNNETAKNKSDFFLYLEKSMKNAEYEYKRKYEQGLINIPREKNSKFRKVEDFIRMKENQLGRKLTVDEEESCISKWFNKKEYIDLYNAKNVGKMHVKNNETNETDELEFPDTHTADPLDELINKNDMETVLEAVTSVLERKQKRARGCYKALFTLHCIENYKDFEGLYPILDSRILKTRKENGKKLNQYEIYQIFNPNAQKSSAEVLAATNLRVFLNDIKTYLKEKNK